MKKQKVMIGLLLISIVFFSGCNDTANLEPVVKKSALSLQFNFVNMWEEPFDLLYENHKIGSGFDTYIEPVDKVAGDVLTFEYTGNVYSQEASGSNKFGTINVTGFSSYKYIKTQIVEYVPTKGTIKDNIDELNSTYLFRHSYVVEKVSPIHYRFIPLEEYDGNKLYITLDYRTMYLDENNNKIEYHGEKLVVAALYTSNPRAI